MKRTEVAKTMITHETRLRAEAIASIRGVPVSVVYCEAIAAHVRNDPRTCAGREVPALSHQFGKANDRSLVAGVTPQSVAVRGVGNH